MRLRARTLSMIVALLVALASGDAAALEDPQAPSSAPEKPPSKFRSPEDGWFDVSAFLDEPWGFLPIVMPITEPAVGYGAAGGLAFIGKPRDAAGAGLGRPNISLVGGLGTENGTWGALAGDLRHWKNDRVQTLVGFFDASVNLDFHGVGAGVLPEGQTLHLERDELDRDEGSAVDARLRYAWIERPDGAFDLLNLLLAREGVAIVAIVPPNEKYAGDLRRAQEEAVGAKAGLWGACA